MYKQQGFSLIEMIVYIAILVLLLGIVMTTLISLSQSYRTFTNTRRLTQSAVSVFERITREVRATESVAVTDSNPFDQLDLNSSEEFGDSRFYVENGILKSDDTVANELTNKAIRVLFFNVDHIISSGSGLVQPEALRITLTLTASTQTETFYITTNLRRTYY